MASDLIWVQYAFLRHVFPIMKQEIPKRQAKTNCLGMTMGQKKHTNESKTAIESIIFTNVRLICEIRKAKKR